MPVFDRHIAVDWSASNTPKTGADSIWIAGHISGHGAAPENFRTRSRAMNAVQHLIQKAILAGDRLLIGFDFAFGYPRGFAEMMKCADWADVWSLIHSHIADDDRNSSNRFAVGAAFNQELGVAEGPFWGHPHQHAGRYAGLGPKRPTYTRLPERRLCEANVSGTQPVWKLAYTGSVGSQTLLGIAKLEALRRMFPDAIAVWPFETHFTEDLNKPIILAEIYPSQHDITMDGYSCKDAAQVAAVSRDFKTWDAAGILADKLSAPDLAGADRAIVLREEGWIVGR